MIKGVDVSTLPEVELLGGRFFDNCVEKDALKILKDRGATLLRIRLWNDPYSPSGEPYGAGTNDIDCAESLARRAKELGMSIMLDFHYSDFWADPGKQIMPKAWAGLSLDELVQKVFEFTRQSLKRLVRAGCAPEYVAVGNEISNGLLWEYGKLPDYASMVRLINSGLKAVRESVPLAKTMLHLDNGGDNALFRRWFDGYFAAGGADFDMIGLSYYAFWHGKMSALRDNMRDIALRYKKDMMIVETSACFTLDDYSVYEGLERDERKSAAANEELARRVEFPPTVQGQCDFLESLADVIRSVPDHRCKGFVYWEPAWLPVKGSGWANEAALAYTGEKGPGGNEWANQALFDFEGNALPALDTFKKI